MIDLDDSFNSFRVMVPGVEKHRSSRLIYSLVLTFVDVEGFEGIWSIEATSNLNSEAEIANLFRRTCN